MSNPTKAALQAEIDTEPTTAGQRAALARVIRKTGHSGAYEVTSDRHGGTSYSWTAVPGVGAVKLQGGVVTIETPGVEPEVPVDSPPTLDAAALVDLPRVHREATILRFRMLHALRPENLREAQSIAARLALALLA